jgi:hypothetical protein
MHMKTVRDLVTHICTPPAPKKLAEALEASGELGSLPNVNVYSRRVTPIDKEKMVGRWKIIVDELQKRDLPVIGTGRHGESVEKKWVLGKW